MAAPWRIELLGGLRVQHGTRIITRFPKQKAGALLAYLAYYADRVHSRDALVDVLWPEVDPEAGRNSLRSVLHALRHQLEPAGSAADALVVAHRDTIALKPAAFGTDVADWNAALQAARRADSPAERAAALARAVELYRGELLPGFFEDWILTERPLLAEGHLGALHQLVSLLEQAGDRERALEYARRAVSADPLREEAHYDLMRLYAAAGQPSAALRQYQELERLLREALGETPSAATRALADELRRNARTVVVARGGPPLEPPPSSPPSTQHAARSTPSPLPFREVIAADEPPPSAATAAPSTVAGAPALPPQFSRFFGREEEIAWVAEALRAGTRLVTLTGPGGSGKTRLAIAVAGRLIEAFDVVWFLPLADVTDARQLPETMAGLLGLPPSPNLEPLERIVRALGRQPSLLVLDNLEHLVAEAAPLIRTLLARVPTLTCLVTSRQRLNLAGEQEFALLPLPTPKRSDPLERLREYASVQLFVDRAQAVRPGFQLTPANAEAIATLCDRLEGLPLALELAAARSAVLTPAQMLGHLERRFEFLVSRQRDLPARHRTLLAALEGSYRLLSPELQRFFAQLSVFAGGWTLEAAEQVCAEPRALDFLDELRECSLVVVEETALGSPLSALGESSPVPAGSGEPRAESRSGATMRYRLLEALRQYGAEQLREQGEEAEARGRHLAYFLRWTEAIEPELLGGQHADCYERLESEHDNLRAALAWCKAAPGGVEAGLRLTGVLWRFWDAGSYLTEGCQHLADILSLPEAAGGSREAPLLAARAKALHGAGVLGPRKYGEVVACQYLKESLAIWRELGDKRGIAEVLARLGGYMIIDDHEESRKLLQESLGLYQELGDQQGIATTLSSLGTLAWSQHDDAAARTLYEESLAIGRRLGNRLQEQSILEMLGNISLTEGDLAAARSYLEEGLTIARAFGQKRSIAVGLYFLGHIAFQEGDNRAARVHWEESRRLDRENETKGGAVLGSLAELAAIEGDDEAARALWEQSLAEARELHSPERIARALRELADVARRQREDGKARSLYAQSLQIERELGNPQGSAECLEGLGRVAGAQGQPERAARLFGAAEALSQARASRPHRKGQQLRVQDHPTMATRRAALDEAGEPRFGASGSERQRRGPGPGFAAAWAEGRAMTLDQAVAYALAAFPDA